MTDSIDNAWDPLMKKTMLTALSGQGFLINAARNEERN